MDQGDPALAGLPEPGEPVFYPKVGHCVYRGLTEDRAAPGKKLVELEDLEEGSRILIPTERVPKLGLRPAGRKLDEIQAELAAEFEQPLEEENDLEGLIENLVNDGSPRALAKGLKRLHLLRQTTGLSREDEQTRRKIRSWLAAEVALSKDCTRAEAQALITRILQEAMNAHRRKEREEAKERRRQVKAQKAAEDAAASKEEDQASSGGAGETGPPGIPETPEKMAAAVKHAGTTLEDSSRTIPGEPEKPEKPEKEETRDVLTSSVPDPVPAIDAPAAPKAFGETAPERVEAGRAGQEDPAPAPDSSTTDKTPQTAEAETAHDSPDDANDPSPSEPADDKTLESKETPEPAPELSPELSEDSTGSEPTSPKPS